MARLPDAAADDHMVVRMTCQSSSSTERFAPLLSALRKVNKPYGPGERLVGFVIPEEAAGLSDGLFMLDALVAAATCPSSSTPEVVEAVARAIRHAATGKPLVGEYPLEKWRDQARAAIAALPPSNMIGEAIEALEASTSHRVGIDDGEWQVSFGFPDADTAHAFFAAVSNVRRKARKLRGEG